MIQRFLEGVQKEAKFFIFLCIVLTILRLAFIGMYSYQLPAGSAELIGSALWIGFRLSLKTAGAMMLLSFVFATIIGMFFKKWPSDKWRMYWGSIVVFFITILFFIRIVYYNIFNSAFNSMLINGAYDDIAAIVDTAIYEYGLLWRVPLAIVTACVMVYLFYRWMKLSVYSYSSWKHPKRAFLIIWLLLPIIAVGIRFGGAFNYNGSIHWENAQRLPSNLLNEAILDDIQALYRVHIEYQRTQLHRKLHISKEELRSAVAILGGNPKASTLEDAFIRQVKQPKMLQQPSQVVLVLGESYGLWPFLTEFKAMNIVPEGEKLIASGHAMYTHGMLPNGSGTISAINGFVVGLPSVGLYENYEGETFKSKYQMGIGNTMKRLGYKTVFWYAGFESWQNIKKLALAQGFDEFHSASDFSYEGGNSWGAPDGEMFKAIEHYMHGIGHNEKVFHFIMTATNHPPYTHPIDKEGFPRETVRQHVPDSIANDKNTITQIGHFWYADHVMGQFIDTVKEITPDALFIITGDHSERFSFAKEMGIQTLSAVPMIIYGKGVDPTWIPVDTPSTHIQLIPTLVEMIAPPGTIYYSLYPSLFDHYNYSMNYRLWMEKDTFNTLKNPNTPKEVQQLREASVGVATWRIIRGNNW